MKLPRGQLVRSRVITDPRTVLVDALDRELTGYALLEPQGSLLLDDDGTGVLTFDEGVPVVAYHTGTDRGGPPALADLAASGPYDLELFAVHPGALDAVHDRDAFSVPPGMAADRLAGDQDLADRTRERSSRSRPAGVDAVEADDEAGSEVGAVEAFLDDAGKIEAIREQAREEAQERAEEWGFDV
jgi:hypothetical protein